MPRFDSDRFAGDGRHFTDLDKEYFLTTLGFQGVYRSGSAKKPITDLIESLADRNFFRLALGIPSVHTEFVKRYCQLSKENICKAKAQLGQFLYRNWNFQLADRSVNDVFQELKRLGEYFDPVAD
jgi:hypothetical protein